MYTNEDYKLAMEKVEKTGEKVRDANAEVIHVPIVEEVSRIRNFLDEGFLMATDVKVINKNLKRAMAHISYLDSYIRVLKEDYLEEGYPGNTVWGLMSAIDELERIVRHRVRIIDKIGQDNFLHYMKFEIVRRNLGIITDKMTEEIGDRTVPELKAGPDLTPKPKKNNEEDESFLIMCRSIVEQIDKMIESLPEDYITTPDYNTKARLIQMTLKGLIQEMKDYIQLHENCTFFISRMALELNNVFVAVKRENAANIKIEQDDSRAIR